MTLQPALLSLYGRRGIARRRILPGEPTDPEHGLLGAPRPLDHGAAGASTSSPGRALLRRGGAAGVLAAADARLDVRHPAHAAGDPRLRRAPARGRARARSRRRRCSSSARDRLGARARDAGRDRPARRRRSGATRRSRPSTRRRPAASSTRRRRYEQVIVAGRHDYGFPEAQSFVHRLRATLIPAARLPGRRRRARRRRAGAGRRLPPPGLHATSRR